MSNKRRRHTPEQIIRKLAEGNRLLAGGQELDEVCRHLEIAESTWFQGHSIFSDPPGTAAAQIRQTVAATSG